MALGFGPFRYFDPGTFRTSDFLFVSFDHNDHGLPTILPLCKVNTKDVRVG